MDDGQVVLDADDEGFLLGRSAFETLRSYGGGLFALDTHLERLSASCLSLGIGMPNEKVVARELLLAASKWLSEIPEGHLEKVPAGSSNILSKWTRACRLLFTMLNPPF